MTALVDMVWNVEDAKPWVDMSASPLTILEASTWAWLMVATEPRDVDTADGWDAELMAPRSNSKSTWRRTPAAQRYWS